MQHTNLCMMVLSYRRSAINYFLPKYFSACRIIQFPHLYPKAPGKFTGNTKDNVTNPIMKIRCHLSARKIVYKVIQRMNPFQPSHRVTAMVGSRPESWGVSWIFHFEESLPLLTPLPLFCNLLLFASSPILILFRTNIFCNKWYLLLVLNWFFA